jgi:hypothetical protein
MLHETELNLNFVDFVNFRENKDNTHCLFLLCFVREHVQSPVSRDIMTKLFFNVHKKITNLVDFFPNASVESDNFAKITCGFFLLYLPNFLVGHLYILLNKKKMFARNWRVRVSKFSLLCFAKQLQEGNPLF